MKFSAIVVAVTAAGSALAASQDYARHLELNFLFYEAQRSGHLPETNRIPWRGDSGLNHGSDVGVDLTGGYYDAGDNVKFNFPQAFSMTVISWLGIEFAKGVEMANQSQYLKDTVRWGCDYLLKCHQKGSDIFYMQVGDGDIDHQYWKAVEDIDYPTPAFYISPTSPGTEVSGETAAALASASILFKDSDPEYSSILLDQALEWYEFADKYKADYSISVPKAGHYYKSWNGYKDELAWAAIWLYRAIGDKAYLEKAKSLVSNYKLNELGIDWDSKYQGVIVILAQLGIDEYVQKVETWVKTICTKGKFSKGGLYINQNSEWGSNRRASAMAASLIFYTHNLPKGNEIHDMALKFAKSQADYIQGANPLGIDYVVGADESSPRSVHHRSASGASCIECEPLINAHIIYGALAGGPYPEDEYIDNRADYERNEIALDYNVCYAAVLAYLIQEGLNVDDPIPVWEHDYRLTKSTDQPIPPATQQPQPTEKSNKCWSEELGYSCCPKDQCEIYYTDDHGSWSYTDNNEWCGIDPKICNDDISDECWSQASGYPCCPNGCDTEIYTIDDDGKWGVYDDQWCGIPTNC